MPEGGILADCKVVATEACARNLHGNAHSPLAKTSLHHLISVVVAFRRGVGTIAGLCGIPVQITCSYVVTALRADSIYDTRNLHGSNCVLLC